MLQPRGIMNSRRTKETKHANSAHFGLSRRPIVLLLALLVAPLLACGGGSGGGDTASSNATSAATGTFVDAAVSGLHYQTPTHSGTTDTNGTFSYMPGETVTFYMGDVMLGQGTAKSAMTPVDLVPGATDKSNPAVTNMARMLQTADNDGDPSNGIMIPDAVETEMFDRRIDFDMTPQAFAQDPDITMLMDALADMDPAYAGRMLVSAEDAQLHMGQTLADMGMSVGNGSMTGTGNGPMSTGGSGTMTGPGSGSMSTGGMM